MSNIRMLKSDVANIANAKALANMALAIGKFDGIHIGHKRLIGRITDAAVPAIMTFERKDTQNGGYMGILTGGECREMMISLGVKEIIEYPVNEESFNVTPEDFVKNILVDELSVERVVCGEDFRFGRGRAGDTGTLMELGGKYGFEVCVEPDVRVDGEKVSSSLIREYIRSGDVKKAAAMLGYRYFIKSEVIHGNRFGRTMGIPTINMKPQPDKLIPPNGVYRTKLIVDGREYKGITNIGIKPTVSDKDELLCETNIIGYSGDLYGREIKVDFYERVRGERKFSSIDELKRAIMNDINNYKKECEE